MKTRIFFTLCVSGLIAMSCKSANDTSDIKESYDGANNPELFGAKSLPYEKLKDPDFLKGKRAEKPWTDTYWPLYKAGLAHRWINPSMEFDLNANPSSSTFATDISRKITAAMKSAKGMVGKPPATTAAVSPAEKIDLALGRESFPLLQNELQTFAKNSADFKDIQWQWMGHCHGWAPAAFMEKKPKNGVLFKNPSGQTIFFSPGDIRGVLTKAASDNGYEGNERFLGSRCDDPAIAIPRDNLNRIIDASIGIYDPSSYFSESIPFKVQLDGINGSDNIGTGSLVGRVGPRYRSSPLIWLEASRYIDGSKKIYGVTIYSTKKVAGELVRDQIIAGDSESDIGLYVDTNGQPIKENGNLKRNIEAANTLWKKVTAAAPASIKSRPTKLAMKYWKECRDANPGSFHLVLAGLMSKGGKGNKTASSFVMDITRDDQVWNHPLYEYQSWMGTPTELKLDTAEDPFKAWRAKGTKKIVDVYTRVTFSVEAGPRIIYQPNQEATQSMLLRYTLELDVNGVVLGGEWHPVRDDLGGEPKPLSGKDLLINLKAIASAEDGSWAELQHPDFIWGPASGSKIADGRLLPAQFVKKLSECSQMEATDQFKINNISVPVVTCSL